MRTKVSIITPSFNREAFVSQTLDSLLAQTYESWENVVVDDGSTDKTKEIISEYAVRDSRIKLYDRDEKIKPKGACACRNQGVDLCEGKYLIFLDTDDLLEPFCLEQRAQVMEDNPELDFAIFPSLMFREKPHDLGLWWNIDKETDELTRQFHQDAICQGTGVIWRKSAFNRIGQWDEALYLWQDIDLFFRAYIQDYKYQKFFNLPPDLHNRRLESSLSRADFFSMTKMQSRIEVVKRAVKLLKDNRKEAYIREARYMTAEITSGLSRVGEQKGALEIIAWAKGESVLNDSEISGLKKMLFFRSFKLDKLPWVTKKIRQLESQFSSADCTMCVLPYEVN